MLPLAIGSNNTLQALHEVPLPSRHSICSFPQHPITALWQPFRAVPHTVIASDAQAVIKREGQRICEKVPPARQVLPDLIKDLDWLTGMRWQRHCSGLW